MRTFDVKLGYPMKFSTWPRSFGRHPSLSLSLTAAVLLAGASSALAQSGETSNTQGVYQIPAEDCNELRATTGVSDGNVLFTCDADRGAEGQGEQCRLFIPEQELEEGLALGFCADRFPDGVVPHEDGPVEENTTLLATTFGGDIGFLNGLDGDQGDLFCETFIDGSKVCRRVIEGDCSVEGACLPCDDDPNAAGVQEFILTQADDCELLEELLTGAVTGDPDPNPAFGVFFDVDAAGQPESEALLVCPGFQWQCVPDPGTPIDGQVTFEYVFKKHIIQTPGCLKVGGTCYRY